MTPVFAGTKLANARKIITQPKDRVGQYGKPVWAIDADGELYAVLVGYDVETDNNFKPVKMVYISNLRDIKMNGICYGYERITADTYEEVLESAILLAIELIARKEAHNDPIRS